MIKWKLASIMANHQILGNELAKKLGVTPTTISSMRRSKTMPTMNGIKLNRLCHVLSDFAGEVVTPGDLIDFKHEGKVS